MVKADYQTIIDTAIDTAKDVVQHLLDQLETNGAGQEVKFKYQGDAVLVFSAIACAAQRYYEGQQWEEKICVSERYTQPLLPLASLKEHIATFRTSPPSPESQSLDKTILKNVRNVLENDKGNIAATLKEQIDENKKTLKLRR